MTLWLRRTGLASPADADRADYLVIEHDKVIGRIYEERSVPGELRWFCQPPSTLILRWHYYKWARA